MTITQRVGLMFFIIGTLGILFQTDSTSLFSGLTLTFLFVFGGLLFLAPGKDEKI